MQHNIPMPGDLTGPPDDLTSREGGLSYNRAEASVRGTFKGIEVKRRGGEQAHRRVGSLKLLQDLHNIQSALRPAPAPIFL